VYLKYAAWRNVMENKKKSQRTLILVMIINFLISIIKICLGLYTKSTSMTADGFHSISDTSSNIMGIIGLHYASKPKDKKHPYGHYKFETLASLFISFMLFALSGQIVVDAISKFINPTITRIPPISIAVLIFTIVVNTVVSVWENKKGKELNSQVLVSDSIHTRSDIFVSLGVLVTLILLKLGANPIIDPIASLVVAVFIIHAALKIFKDSSFVLVDGTQISEDDIRNIVMEFDEVVDVHKIRSRGSLDNLNIDLHIVVNADLDVEKSHILVHDIEDAMKEKFNKNTQVLAHVEPDN
jgi:cation diffusion facilitator family transporter